MTRPPPPVPYETWLDYAFSELVFGEPRLYGKTELAELRAERDKYKPYYDAIIDRHNGYSMGYPPESPAKAITELMEEAEAIVSRESELGLLAELFELKTRHAETVAMVAQLQSELDTAKAEPRQCLVCGIILHEPTPDAADEYLRAAKEATNG